MVRRPPEPDVIGDGEERHPDEPVESPAAPVPGLLDDVVDGLLGDAEVHEGSPLVVRVVRGRWLPSLASALPAVVATMLAVAAGTVALLAAEQPGSDEPLLDGLTVGRWLRYVFAGVGMAFGGPFSSVSRGDGDESQTLSILAVPLTVTALALFVLWLCVRRFVDGEDRLADAVRAAAVFAAGIGAVSAFGRWTEPGEIANEFFGDSQRAVTALSVHPFKAMFWAFLAALAVAYVAQLPLRVPLAVQGAVAGIATGVVVSFLVLVGLAYALAGRVEAVPSDVTTVLPTALGYGIPLGVAGFGVASGGEVASPFSDGDGLSLWASWMPGGYAAALLIPFVAVAAGVWWITRYGFATREEAARACSVMALPAALLWWLLSLAGSVAYRFDVFFVVGGIKAGASPWTALLVLVWFGVLGWLAGRLLLRGNLSEATDRRSLPFEAAEGPDPSGDPRR